MFFNKSKYQVKQIRNKLIKRFNTANEILENMEVPDSLIDSEIIDTRNSLVDNLYTSTIDSLAENVEQFEEVVCNYKLKVLKEGFLTKGVDGYPGMQGPMGMTGEPGESAYEIAVRLGFEGTEEEWIKSLKPEQEKFTIKELDLGSNIPITDGGPSGTELKEKYDSIIDYKPLFIVMTEFPDNPIPGKVYKVDELTYFYDRVKYQQITPHYQSLLKPDQEIFKVNELPEIVDYSKIYSVDGHLYNYPKDIGWIYLGILSDNDYSSLSNRFKPGESINSNQVEYITELPEKGTIGLVYKVSNVDYFWDGENYAQVKYVKVDPINTKV